MKWMLGLVVGLSCISGVVCAGNSTSSINKVNDQRLLEKLIEACEEDNINEAGDIINNIKNLNCQTSDGKTALMIASYYGYEGMVKTLLDYKVDANKSLNTNRATALILAVQNGHEKIVKMLLKYGVDANVQAYKGDTALMLAAQNGHEKIVKMLLKYGVDANVQRKDGATALMLAAQDGHEKIVEMLLKYGVDVNKSLIADGATALIVAVEKGYEKVVEMLLDYKVDANAQCQDRITALIIAAENGYEKIVEMLLKYKVDANAYLNTTRATALILAVEKGYEKIVELLLDYKVDANMQNCNGNTALMIAVDRGYEKIVELLLKYRADANIQDCDGDTALIMAVQKGYEKIVRVLLEHGVNSCAQRKDGITALIMAVGKGNKKIAELLIEHGAYTEFKIKANNHTAFDVLDNLFRYNISLEDEKIQYLKYILNGARAVDKWGLNSALIQYPQVKEMLVKRALMGINKVYKEDLAIRDINDQQAQSNALLISNLLRVKKPKIKSIQDNHADILDEVYKDEYFKQQAIEAGHFGEYKSKKYVFRNLSKAIKNQRFSDLVVCTQDNF